MKVKVTSESVEKKASVRVVVGLYPLHEAVVGTWDGEVAQLVRTSDRHAVRFLGTARDFSPRVNFQCRLSYVCPYTPVRNCMHLHLRAR